MLDALLLGLIEGLTEFLPISSTGHLLIAEHWLGQRSDLFNIVIQAGAILAVTLVYRARLFELAGGWRRPEPRDYTLKLAGSFAVTAVLGLIVKKLGFKLPETVTPVAIALIVGGFAIFIIEAWAKRQPPRDTVTWKLAIAVGIAQVIAGVFPGTSRSAAAIFAAMLFGLTDRGKAAEFAFLVGIPTMFAASAVETLSLYKNGGLQTESGSELAVAIVVSAITGFISVKWLLRYVSTHDFKVFAWYRIALGVLLLALL
ncbi:MAG: Undecaprenyl-diphosphatase [Hydrocarboniphaga sp.]|nr:undecaprenyl-diphosphate phosphatase [Hydrocarboniphaga sp.]MDB5968253.1 Undecaprenyl-diphosphatase [Hydrocarboniphaga sp.]